MYINNSAKSVRTLVGVLKSKEVHNETHSKTLLSLVHDRSQVHNTNFLKLVIFTYVGIILE